MEDLSYYMEEGCGIYAMAVARQNPNAEIYILSRRGGEAYSRSIPYEITHAYCHIPGVGDFDVKGKRSPQEMAADFDMVGDYDVKGPFFPAEFYQRFMGNSDSKPLFGTKKDIKDVVVPKIATYTAYVLTNAARDLVLKNFPPKFPDVICHHVTYEFREKSKLEQRVYDVFHGTDEDFDEFSDEFRGSGYGTAPIAGFNFTDSEKVAKTFGDRIIQAKVTINHPYIIDAKGRAYDEYKHTINDHLRKVDKSKCDGIIIKNYQDAGRHGHYILSNHYIPFSTDQIHIVKSAATKGYAGPFALYIEVPKDARDHFWDDDSE